MVTLKSMGGLAIVAIRSFCATMLLMVAVGVVLAAATYLFLARHQPWYGVIGGLAAMLEAIAVGLVWASKRAVLTALAQGLKEYRIGQAAVRLIFERLLGVDEHRQPGEREGIVARTLERIPLAQAEKRLREAVQAILDSPAERGGLLSWGKRWLQARLLRYVEAFTLARFRERGSQQGGIDLFMVQMELENQLDEALVTRLTAGLRLWTMLILLGLPTQVFATVYIVLALLK